MSNDENDQALLNAAFIGNMNAVRRALENGANVNAKDTSWFGYGITPLHYASSWKGHAGIVSLLLENGANIHVTDGRGAIPLHDACLCGQLNTCSLLLQQHGAKKTINAKTHRYGDTPLHKASYNGYASICLLLLQNGADPNITNNNGKTPLQDAQDQNKHKCVDVINQFLQQQEEEMRQLEQQAKEKQLLEQQAEKKRLEQEAKQKKLLEQQIIKQRFYQHFDELKILVEKATINQVITLVPTFQRACQDMTDFLQLKFFFTAVNAQHRLGTITSEDRRRLIVASLDKAKDWCTSSSNVALFRTAVSYSKLEGTITKIEKYQYNEEATLQNVSNSDLIQAMQAAIQQNTARIDQMENAFVKFQAAAATSIQDLQRNLVAINESVDSLRQDTQTIAKTINKLQATYAFKKHVEAGCSLVSAILNAVSFGAAGTALQSVLELTVAHIADFGDLSHLQSVMTTLTLPHDVLEKVGEISVKDMLKQGIALVENYGNSALEDAIVDHNAIVIMSASATVFTNALQVEEVGNIPPPAQKHTSQMKDAQSVPMAHAMVFAPSNHSPEKKHAMLIKKLMYVFVPVLLMWMTLWQLPVGKHKAAHRTKVLRQDDKAGAVNIVTEEFECQNEEIREQLDGLRKLKKKLERKEKAAQRAKGLGQDDEAGAIYVEIKEIEHQIEEIHDALDELDTLA